MIPSVVTETDLGGICLTFMDGAVPSHGPAEPDELISVEVSVSLRSISELMVVAVLVVSSLVLGSAFTFVSGTGVGSGTIPCNSAKETPPWLSMVAVSQPAIKAAATNSTQPIFIPDSIFTI